MSHCPCQMKVVGEPSVISCHSSNCFLAQFESGTGCSKSMAESIDTVYGKKWPICAKSKDDPRYKRDFRMLDGRKQALLNRRHEELFEEGRKNAKKKAEMAEMAENPPPEEKKKKEKFPGMMAAMARFEQRYGWASKKAEGLGC